MTSDQQSPDKSLPVRLEKCAAVTSPALSSTGSRDNVRVTGSAGTVLKHQSSRQSVKRCATPNSGWL